MIFSSQPPFLVDVPKCSDMIFPWKPPFTTDFPRKSGRHPWWHRKAGVPGADAERLREAGVEVRVDRWAPFRVCLGARCGLLLDGRNGFFASMYKVMYVSIYNVRPQLDSIQLVNITPITMVYGIYNYSYWGESKPTYNWGASHCSHGTYIGVHNGRLAIWYVWASENGVRPVDSAAPYVQTHPGHPRKFLRGFMKEKHVPYPPVNKHR
jgi:hypothetical protein